MTQRAVVVGGGILGTWHAYELVEAGFVVEHLEADAGPVGASVRNFGLVWVSGRRSGEELEVALRSRRRWEEVGSRVPGLGFRANGSLTVACDETERAVMQTYAAQPEARARAVTFLEPDEVRACNPALSGAAVTGALHCALDGAVEPRQATNALRADLEQRVPQRYAFHPGCRAVSITGRAVVDSTGRRWEGDVVVVATGTAYDHLVGTLHLAPQLRRVRLQMFETEPFAESVTTSIADADSMRYYPAYDVAPLGDLAPQSALAAEYGMQLLLVQRLDGGLTIGDTHAYGEPFDFALCEDPTDELLARATRLIGSTLPRVRRRWEGVYAQCVDGRVCLREEVADAVWVVTGPGGRGMTCSAAIAADTLAKAGVAA